MTDPIAALRTSLAKARDYTEDSYRSREEEAAAWADVDAKLAEVKAELDFLREGRDWALSQLDLAARRALNSELSDAR